MGHSVSPRSNCILSVDYYQNFISSLPITAEKTNESRQTNTPEDTTIQPATGLLLIFPTLFVHYLEVTNTAMRMILEDLHQSIHSRDGLIREASILNISYNVCIDLSRRPKVRFHLFLFRSKHVSIRIGHLKVLN